MFGSEVAHLGAVFFHVEKLPVFQSQLVGLVPNETVLLIGFGDELPFTRSQERILRFSLAINIKRCRLDGLDSLVYPLGSAFHFRL